MYSLSWEWQNRIRKTIPPNIFPGRIFEKKLNNLNRINNECTWEIHTLNNIFCSSLNFSIGSTDEKFISLDTALHFNISLGTRASCSLSGKELKCNINLVSRAKEGIVREYLNLQIFVTLPKNTACFSVANIHPVAITRITDISYKTLNYYNIPRINEEKLKSGRKGTARVNTYTWKPVRISSAFAMDKL